MVAGEERQIYITNCFLNRLFDSDSDPPVSSLVLASAARFVDYDLAFALPQTDENYVTHSMQYLTIRSTGAYLGSMVVPLSIFIVRTFGGTLLVGCILPF
jgi:dolichyl-phosphate-mannose--protein O-mannosyl transferase